MLPHIAMPIALVLCRSIAFAQICGDADGSQTISVTDGVQVLRAAALLASTCSGVTCDVNGNGTVTVTDGVQVLRAAAGLPATLGCGAEITGFVSSVQTSEGAQAVVEIGAPPTPGPGAPITVGQPQGNTNVIPGGSNDVRVPLNTGASATVDGQRMLVIAVADVQGNPFDGFYELPLPDTTGEIHLRIVFPQNLANQTFVLSLATRGDGVLSQYASLMQVPVQVAAGTVQVSLSFHPSQDVDLHLVEPSGQEIYWNNRESPSGGLLDLDSNAGCFPVDNVNNENITYPSGTTPPTGEYIVRVDYSSSCDGGGAEFTVVVNNNGVQSSFSGTFTAADADGGDAGSGREITRFRFSP